MNVFLETKYLNNSQINWPQTLRDFHIRYVPEGPAQVGIECTYGQL